MLISPHTAIEKGWLKFPAWADDDFKKKCVMPNAIDFTLDRLFETHQLPGNQCPKLSETEKRMLPAKEIFPTREDCWVLYPGILYDGMSDFFVEVPENVACNLIIRSTLNRMGLHLQCGLYDSFYFGSCGITLFNRGPSPILIEPHTRVGQIMFIESQSIGKYAGGYNTAAGQHWTEALAAKNEARQ